MELEKAFRNYANARTGRMEGRMFVKVFRQAGLLGSMLTANDLDIIFVKHRTRGTRTIDYGQFAAAVDDAAKTAALDLEEVRRRLDDAGYPVYMGTDTLPVRFYDDKTLYTGVHAHGGPSTR